jgi:hypothetical protein
MVNGKNTIRKGVLKMIKSNSKTAKDRINEYVLKCKTKEELKEYIDNYNKCYSMDKSITLGKFLVNYDLTFQMWYEEQREAIAQWLEETEAEKLKYTDTQVNDLYCYLIERSVLSILNYKLSTKYLNGRIAKIYIAR